ncbi:MAG: mechanosensitive ion channel [Candidatus Methanomethylicia archaeon]
MDRSRIILIAIILMFSLWALTIPGILPEEMRQTYLMYSNIIRALTTIIIGIIVIETIASLMMMKLRHLGREVYIVRNIIIVGGYILIGFIILTIFETTGIGTIAGATVTGLVVGLGLQPILANLFAGLIILGTGFMKPGTRIKISGGIPISPSLFPAYKAFSRDEYIPTLRGIVNEIGLMYTKILSDDGELVKIPNNMALSSSIVLEERSEPKTVKVRYEFPVKFDPEIVLSMLKEELNKNFNDCKVYLEEQSDKTYYIVMVIATTPPHAKVREFRSEILKHVIKVHRILEG